jgi:Uma2 family endonuclease
MLDPLRIHRGAEHAMGMPAVIRRWSRADVLALIDDSPLHSPRYETVDGALLVTPSPGGAHQFAVVLLARLLADYCEKSGVGEVIVAPFDVELEPATLVQPDVFVVPLDEAARLRRERTARRLLIAVEVLSPGSEASDRGRKRELYERTVPDYWIVDLEARRVGRHATYIEWSPAGVSSPFVLDLPAFFARVWGDDVVPTGA